MKKKRKETWFEFYLHLPFLSQTIMVEKQKYNKVKTFKFFFLLSLCIFITKYIHIFNKS